jgi:hypothetical protein
LVEVAKRTKWMGKNYTILDKILFHLLPCLEILLLDLEGLMEYLELKMFGSLIV